ncbi:hypothetical protein E2P64_00330 [Candidatus Bathyarchaeota archaeon]|nr:hypothetical protein E2P64_00330 [Candidatus Bathyarchaeota archaeon]
MRGIAKVVLALVALALVIYIVPRGVRAIGGATNVTPAASETFTPINGSIAVTAGNIYEFNLTTTDKTYRWVGLWGNITGTINLRAASNDFYTWSFGTITADSVLYATTDPTGVDPTNFNITNNTHLDQADTAYGYAGTVTDRIENTYTSSGTFQSPSMETGITVNTTTLQSATWTNYFLRKTNGNIATTNDIVWAVEINPNQAAFDGTTYADYEILLPENEEVGDGEGVVTTYYLWLELN